jgi:hypothetical protein
MSIHRNIGIKPLEHFAFRWNHLKVGKMLQSQKHRASFARKTAHTFAHDALAHAECRPAPWHGAERIDSLSFKGFGRLGGVAITSAK